MCNEEMTKRKKTVRMLGMQHRKIGPGSNMFYGRTRQAGNLQAQEGNGLVKAWMR